MSRLPTNHKIAFTLMLVSGIALCVGGIWLAPLLIPGAALISGAVGMYSGVFVEEPEPVPSNEYVSVVQPDEDEIDISVRHVEPITNQYHLHLRHRHGDHSDHIDINESPDRPRLRHR